MRIRRSDRHAALPSLMDSGQSLWSTSLRHTPSRIWGSNLNLRGVWSHHVAWCQRTSWRRRALQSRRKLRLLSSITSMPRKLSCLTKWRLVIWSCRSDQVNSKLSRTQRLKRLEDSKPKVKSCLLQISCVNRPPLRQGTTCTFKRSQGAMKVRTLTVSEWDASSQDMARSFHSHWLSTLSTRLH